MTYKLHRHGMQEPGFALVELLVVCMIIGVLAAIGIPSFFGQSHKANDAAAKAQGRAAQTAEEAVAAEHDGDYSYGTLPALESQEPTLTDTDLATPSVVSLSSSGYSLTSTSNTTHDSFTITRASNGTVSHTCTGSGGGCFAGTW